jgi:Ankyrin repeats (many copies)/Ankyrin repeats (3 copies)
MTTRVRADGAPVCDPNRREILRLSFAFLLALVLSYPTTCAHAKDLTTELVSAARTGQISEVQALLARGAKVNATNKAMKLSALSAAVAGSHVEMVELLLDHSADVNSRDIIGRTPLDWAIQVDSKEIVEVLLAHKVNPNERDGGGNTPLHKAVAMAHQVSYSQPWSRNAAEGLVAHGADVNAYNNAGETPLHLAAQQADTNAVEFLLANKADVNARDKRGETPLSTVETAEQKFSRRIPNAKHALANWFKLHMGLTIDEVDALLGPFPDWVKDWVNSGGASATQHLPTFDVAVTKFGIGEFTAESARNTEGLSVTLNAGTFVVGTMTVVPYTLKFKNGTLSSWTMSMNVFPYEETAALLREHGGHE